MDGTDVETLDLTTDEALLSSISEHKVEELKLEPYSLLRQAIAADLLDIDSGTFYSAIMTVWVCTLSEDEALEAHADFKSAKKKAFAWAEARGYSYYNWRAVVDIYVRLQREWAAVAKARVQQPDSLGGNGQEPDEIPNAGGRPA
jgi:hypothetical protein